MIRKFLDISTAHLNAAGYGYLNENAMLNQAWQSDQAGGYSAIIYAPETELELEMLPATLRDIFIYARLNGAEYVLFDSDGPVLKDLPRFDYQGNRPIALAKGVIFEQVFERHDTHDGDDLQIIDILTQNPEQRGHELEAMHPRLRAAWEQQEKKGQCNA